MQNRPDLGSASVLHPSVLAAASRALVPVENSPNPVTECSRSKELRRSVTIHRVDGNKPIFHDTATFAVENT